MLLNKSHTLHIINIYQNSIKNQKVEKDGWALESVAKPHLQYNEAKKFYQGKCVEASREAPRHLVMAKEARWATGSLKFILLHIFYTQTVVYLSFAIYLYYYCFTFIILIILTIFYFNYY